MCCCRHRLGCYVLSSASRQNLSKILSSWALNVFEWLLRISPPQRVEVVDIVIFGQMIAHFEARLEKILKHSNFPVLRVKSAHHCGRRLWQFGNYVDIVIKNCRIVVVCQLLKVQQKFGRFRLSQGYSHWVIAVDW